MKNEQQPLSLDEAQRHVAENRAVFDRLYADGRPGNKLDQGGTNYYLTDPVEKRNFELFVTFLSDFSRKTGNRSVLVAACGEGLETELLLKMGFDVTAFDFSQKAIDTARVELLKKGLTANLFVDDLTNLDLSKYHKDFAGVMFAQASSFIPAVKNDQLLRKCVADLASRTTRGFMYISTTRYDNQRLERSWIPHGDNVGKTIYYSRSPQTIAQMIQETGMGIIHQESYDATLEGKGEYKNDYFIARR